LGGQDSGGTGVAGLPVEGAGATVIFPAYDADLALTHLDSIDHRTELRLAE